MTTRSRLFVASAVIVGSVALMVVSTKFARAEKDGNKKPSAKRNDREAPPQGPVAVFMREKLAASQSVLEGLMTDDFAKIKEGAEKMIVMSNAAEWKVIQGPVYAQYSTDFRGIAERLAKAAEKKDLDGAGLSYTQLTMSCISCHKYVKGTRIVIRDRTTSSLVSER